MAFSTGIIAGLAASLSIEWMRYLMVVLIGVVGALFWQLNEVREEAERLCNFPAVTVSNNGLLKASQSSRNSPEPLSSKPR